MEEENSFLLLFQCKNCMQILFTQNETKNFNYNYEEKIDGQQMHKIQLPFKSIIQIEKVILQNNTFLFEMICPYCKKFVAHINLLNDQMFILQSQNLVTTSFDYQQQINKTQIDDSFETILSVENQEKIELEIYKIEDDSKLNLNPALEYINFSKKIEKFIEKERIGYQNLEASLSHLENLSELCLKITEDLVKQAFRNLQKAYDCKKEENAL